MKTILLMSLMSFSFIGNAAPTTTARCEAKNVECELKTKAIVGQACQCQTKSGPVSGRIVFVSNQNSITANTFKSAKIVGDYLCTDDKLEDFNFESEYGTLFSNTYLNGKNLNKEIAVLSTEVNNTLKQTCDKDHTLATWPLQSCYQSCAKTFKKKDDIAQQCYATCTSLNRKIESLITDVAALLEANKLSTESCEKSVRVNESGRDKIKKAVEHSTPSPSDMNKSTLK